MPAAPPSPGSCIAVERRARAARLPCLLALTALLLAALPSPGAAQTQPPPQAFPARVGVVADATGTLEARAIGQRFAQALGDPYRIEGLVLVLGDCTDDADRVLDRALVHYGLSPRLGEMADDAMAWLVCRQPDVARFAYAVRNPYAPWLDPVVVEGVMNDALVAGGPGAAVQAGIGAVATALAPAPRPTAPSSAPLVAAEAEAVNPPASGLVLLLVVAGALFVGAWLRAARRPPAAAGDWLPRLQDIAERTAQLAPEITRDAPRLARLVQQCEPLGEPVRLALYRRHESMTRRLGELDRRLVAETGPLAARGAVDDEAAGVRARREALFVAFEGLRSYVERLDRERAHAEHLAGHAPETIAAAAEAVQAAVARYEATNATLGDDPRLALPDAEHAFALPRAWLARAERRLAEGSHLKAARDAEDAVDLATRAERAARGVAAADARIARAAADLRAAGALAPSALACVRGNGAEAEAVLEGAAAALGAALRAPEAALGADPAAGLAANLLGVEAGLERAGELCDALEARVARLTTAAGIAPSAVAAAADALRMLVLRRGARTPRLAAPGPTRPLGPAGAAPAAADAESALDPVAAAIQRAEDCLVAAEQRLSAVPPDPAAALRRTLEGERWLVEAESARRGRRTDGGRRRKLALTVLSEIGQDVGLWLAFHRADAAAVAVRRAEDAVAAIDGARAELSGATGHAQQRLRALLGATAAAVGVAEEAVGRLAADHAKAERGRASERALPAPDPPLPVDARRSPFPGRFGDWPTVARVAPPVRAVRWGAPAGESSGAQSWGAGLDGW